MNKHPTMVGVVWGVIGTILVGIAVWLAIVYTGAYNVAASDQHFDPVRWSFDTTMRRSVSTRAGGAEVPEDPSEEVLAEGAGHYAATCAPCHGAPGEEPSTWSRGMRPEPPQLVEAAKEWTAQEIHWIVSNGLKMTGMPAFGENHSAEELNAITAFVTAIPGLTPEDYERLTGAAEGHGDGEAQPEAAEPQNQ